MLTLTQPSVIQRRHCQVLDRSEKYCLLKHSGITLGHILGSSLGSGPLSSSRPTGCCPFLQRWFLVNCRYTDILRIDLFAYFCLFYRLIDTYVGRESQLTLRRFVDILILLFTLPWPWLLNWCLPLRATCRSTSSNSRSSLF